MVDSLKPIVITNGNRPTDARFTRGETIHFGSLEFIVERFTSMCLSPEQNDSGVMFVGMVHSGLPSLHTILKESADESKTTSSRGGSSGLPIS
jgi:hypothetical protein